MVLKKSELIYGCQFETSTEKKWTKLCMNYIQWIQFSGWVNVKDKKWIWFNVTFFLKLFENFVKSKKWILFKKLHKFSL